MCSKPLCNLFRIFFLAAVAFIHSDRAFYDPLRAQSATVPQNSPFLLHFSVFAQFFLFRMRLFAAGLSGWVGALREGWQVCGARFPFFRGAMGNTAPLQTVCCVCGGGCVFGGLHARQRDAVLPLQRGAGLLQICHSLFCLPCPAPDSRFPLADLYLRQLLR